MCKFPMRIFHVPNKKMVVDYFTFQAFQGGVKEMVKISWDVKRQFGFGKLLHKLGMIHNGRNNEKHAQLKIKSHHQRVGVYWTCLGAF